jgi:hypothetical protein
MDDNVFGWSYILDMHKYSYIYFQNLLSFFLRKALQDFFFKRAPSSSVPNTVAIFDYKSTTTKLVFDVDMLFYKIDHRGNVK